MQPRERVGEAAPLGAASPEDGELPDSIPSWPDESESTHEEPSPLERMGDAPLLSLVSAGGALTDLACNRILVPMLTGRVNDDLVRWLVGIGAWPRNLAALAGLVALTIALVSYLRMRGGASMVRRLFVASFAGIFMPTVVLAIVMPRERTHGDVVLFATAAANVLATLLSSSAARSRAPAAWRAAAGVVGVTTFSALAWLTASRVHGIAETSFGPTAASIAAGATELGYLATIVLIGVLCVPREPTLRDRIAIGIGAATIAGVGAMFVASARWLRSDFSTVLYAGQRLDLLLERAPLVYALPLAIASGCAVAALLGSSKVRRQAGGGVLLLIAAGCAPRSPGALLTMLLGVALIARAVLAHSSPEAETTKNTTARTAAPNLDEPPPRS